MFWPPSRWRSLLSHFIIGSVIKRRCGTMHSFGILTTHGVCTTRSKYDIACCRLRCFVCSHRLRACLLSLACLLLVAIACLLKTKICFNKNGKERRRAVTERTSKEKSKKDDTKATRCLARLSRSNPSSIISGSVHQKEFQHSLLII
jgi:hypothetical protein